MTNDTICRRKHIKLNQIFADIHCIRSTDKLIVCNTIQRPKNRTQIEFISDQWNGPALLLQHYFHRWIRQYLNDNDQPILITDGYLIKLNNRLYICLNAFD